MHDRTRCVRRLTGAIRSFVIGAPFVAAFVWCGAYLFWCFDPKAMAPAAPPWFHDPLRLLPMALFGCFFEVLLLFVITVLGLGAFRLGRWIECNLRRCLCR